MRPIPPAKRFNLAMRNRRSIRLRGYDYSQPGAYYVTLCVYQREPLLGEIVDDELRLSQIGAVVQECWLELTQSNLSIQHDDWVIMPNHLHGILVLSKEPGASARTAKPLGRLIGAFKTTSTRRVNLLRNTPGASLWQRNFYEHVIRNDADLERIREYIAANPRNWLQDEYNPSKATPEDGLSRASERAVREPPLPQS